MDAPPLWRCTLMTLVKKYDRLVESELCSASSDKNSSVPGRFLNIGYPKPTDDRKKPDLHVSPSTDILIEKNRERLATGQNENEIGSSMPIHKNSFRWLLPRAPQRRLVYKNGECNVSRTNINKRGRRYLADIFTTLVDIKWRWNLLVFAMAFTFSWFIFAFIWWLICFSHGDLEHYGEPEWKACIAEVYDFPTALLFSIETQQTIGYGTRYMHPHCPVAIITVMIQCCFGIIIQALMTGLVFAKLSRPKKRAQTLMFSQKALICERDGQLCLLFRVGDMRKSHIVEAQVRAIMVSKRVTQEGEIIPLYQRNLQLEASDDEGRLFLVWPITVEHKITPDSPLWDLSADDLLRRHFEILIILEGIVESTGMTTQARTSYLPAEILWGHRFERLVTYKRDDGQYLVDYSHFNRTMPVDTSPESARERAYSSAAAGADDDDDDSQNFCERQHSAFADRSPSTEWFPPTAGGSDTNRSHSNILMADVATHALNVISVTSLAAFGLANEISGSTDLSTAQEVAGQPVNGR